MPVDPHRISEVARRLSTRLEATYGDVSDAEVEGVLVVAAVKRGSRDDISCTSTPARCRPTRLGDCWPRSTTT
jgi:hypothetical protein